jgi:hypothetical protein
LFEVVLSQLTSNALAAAAWSERRSVVASLTGCQAPLGTQTGGGPAELCTETSANNNPPALYQQVVGRVNAETVYDARDEEEEELWREDMMFCNAVLLPSSAPSIECTNKMFTLISVQRAIIPAHNLPL